jgi:hypothetical protein
LGLGEAIADRHKVYLDTKYWLLLREDKFSRSHDPVIAKLSELLDEGVRSKRLICPISTDMFVEIFKQTDPVTLGCSVELVDTLSEGVSVLASKERARMELLHFVRQNIFGEQSCHSPHIFVWTKLPYVLGFTTPCNTPFSPEEELTIQKAFLDQMWGISLADMLDTMGIDAVREMPRMPDISNKLNAGKFVHADQNSSFEQMFLSELAGVLDSLESEFREMFSYLYEHVTGMTPAMEDAPAE